MKKTTFKTIYVLMICLLSFTISYYLRSLYCIKSNDNIFKLDDGIRTLIIGDSHTMAALDPDIINKSKNISLDSENYFFTYYKLRYYLFNNSQIKNVILGFSTHNVSKMSSEMFFYHGPTEKQELDRYYRILDLEGKFRIMSFRKYFIISVLKYDFGIPLEIYKDDFFLKKVFQKNMNKSDYDFIGGYYRSEKSNVNLEDIKKKIKEYYYNDHMIYQGESQLNIEYLNKIIELCAKKGIEVYLYNTPVYWIYKKMIPAENVHDFERVKEEIMKKYRNIVYIDHTDYIHDKDYFGDQDHVNSFGAKIVSRIIDERISRDDS